MAIARYDIVWSPEAIEAVEEIHSDKLRHRLLHRIGLLDQGPGLHRPRYRHESCEILDVVDATFMASYEIRE